MKTKEKVESYKTLGKVESKIITELSKKGIWIFDLCDVKKIIDSNENHIYQIVHSLKNKGWIKSLTAGKYELISFSGKPREDLMVIACNVLWPSYISFWSALNFYKFTEQSPKKIFLATTKRKELKKMDSIEVQFIQIKPERFFGYTKIEGVCVAEKEKALIDSLLFPRYVSLDEICKSLENAKKEISFEKLIDYCIKIGNSSLNKRLGYLIELLKIKIEGRLIEKLHKNISKNFSLLDPTKTRSSKYSKRWFLNLNLSKEDLLHWKKIG
ncbi:MAG: hypothetical protein GW780_04235 [Candidatus Aenigmarchaeota archaeon]|nr:hypothetical protein [Candidatus Aenigmarchaeota archaeon]NCO97262.1 hypothetical protein [Candidatus Aenigmarchaeota archaeon]NCS71344.1 hypothetical protein [Candidatus Aenigmarchaeota archaeon]